MSIRKGYEVTVLAHVPFNLPEAVPKKLPKHNTVTVQTTLIETTSFHRWMAPNIIPGIGMPRSFLCIRDRVGRWPVITEFGNVRNIDVGLDPRGYEHTYTTREKRVWPWYKAFGWWVKQGLTRREKDVTG